MEAEYVALAGISQEASWIKRIVEEIQDQSLDSITIKEDNQACIKLAKDPIDHSRSKHIEIKYHFIREMIKNKVIAITYCPTADMHGDLFTKSIRQNKI